MKVGHARVDLTPPEGSEFYLLGYKSPMRNAPAKGIHDRIFSNALLFDDGESQAFLWTADLLELPDDTAADLKTRLHDTFGISRNNIILGVLHNHSSIRDFHRNWEFGKYNPEYDAFLTQSVLDSYAECRRTLSPGRQTAGFGKWSKFGGIILQKLKTSGDSSMLQYRQSRFPATVYGNGTADYQ